jgi:hypothetical protein
MVTPSSVSLVCMRFRIVCRSTMNFPRRVLLLLCVKPRKLKVSGFGPRPGEDNTPHSELPWGTESSTASST